MDLFLNSLSEESYSLANSAAKAERSHFELQEEYYDLQIYTRQKLIESSLGLHIPSSKSSKDLSKTSKSKTEIIKIPKPDFTSSHVNSFAKTLTTIKKSKIRSKSQNKSANISSLNRPRKTANLGLSSNLFQDQTKNQNEKINTDKDKTKEEPVFLKTLNINTNSSHNYKPQKQQASSRSKQELKFTQRSINLNSSRLTVPSHPFVISPSLGGEGYDYQDRTHFIDIPPIQKERRTGIRKSQSPFFARVFSETANPNLPSNSPLRRPKEETIDYNVQVY